MNHEDRSALPTRGQAAAGITAFCFPVLLGEPDRVFLLSRELHRRYRLFSYAILFPKGQKSFFFRRLLTSFYLRILPSGNSDPELLSEEAVAFLDEFGADGFPVLIDCTPSGLPEAVKDKIECHAILTTADTYLSSPPFCYCNPTDFRHDFHDFSERGPV